MSATTSPVRVATNWVQAQSSDPLTRNAFFLLCTSVANAGFGFVFWTVAANAYPTDTVGQATAVLSACALAGSIANLGLTRTIVRFFANGGDPSTAIATVLSLCLTAAVIVGAGTAGVLAIAGTAPLTPVLVAAIVVVVVAGTAKAVLDAVFVGDRRTSRVFSNTVWGGVVKLAMPIPFAALGVMGLVSSQLLSLVVSVVISAWFLRRMRHRWNARPSRAWLSDKWAFSGASWATDLIGGVPGLVLPALIVSRLGPTDAAHWYIAFMIVGFLSFVCSSVSQSLLAEVSHDESAIGVHLRRASWLILALVVPAALPLALLAPWVLRIFGPSYVDALPAFWLLLASVPLVAAAYVTGTVLNIYKRVGIVAWVNAANAAVVLVVASVATSLEMVAVGWLAGELVNVLLFGVASWRIMRRPPADRYARPRKLSTRRSADA